MKLLILHGPNMIEDVFVGKKSSLKPVGDPAGPTKRAHLRRFGELAYVFLHEK